jgi:F0F1-type ATP synthase assembly protein I
MIIGALRYGGAGAGAALLIANMVFVVFWVPQVHKRFLPEMTWRWPLQDVGRIVMPAILFLMAARQFTPITESRPVILLFLGVVLLLALAVGLLFGDRTRELLLGANGARA